MLDFRDLTGGAKRPPRPESNLSEPARNRVKFLELAVTVAVLLLFRRPNDRKYMQSDAYRTWTSNMNPESESVFVTLVQPTQNLLFFNNYL